jgi:hypothetical protein
VLDGATVSVYEVPVPASKIRFSALKLKRLFPLILGLI